MTLTGANQDKVASSDISVWSHKQQRIQPMVLFLSNPSHLHYLLKGNARFGWNTYSMVLSGVASSPCFLAQFWWLGGNLERPQSMDWFVLYPVVSLILSHLLTITLGPNKILSKKPHWGWGCENDVQAKKGIPCGANTVMDGCGYCTWDSSQNEPTSTWNCPQ